MNHIYRLALVSVMACSMACSGKLSDAPAPTNTPGKKVDLATAGSLSGTVRFEGTPPDNELLRLSTDKKCVLNAGPNPQSDAILVSADGALKNTFVYVKDGLESGYAFDPPAGPAKLDQHGCIYTPRVLGVRVGQSIEIVNSDDTMHNVHALPMVNQEFNKSQPKVNDRMTTAFTAPEVMVRFKCDVHGWMAAHVGVVDHPYFAVSDAAGRFEIKDLPPGTYTLEAWHEKFGRSAAKVTVAEKQAQTVAFSFAAQPK
jgi:hypothetical protein